MRTALSSPIGADDAAGGGPPAASSPAQSRGNLERGGLHVGGCEALPPAGVAERPAGLALGLGVGGAARLGGHDDLGLGGEDLGGSARVPPGRFGAEALGQLRQPYGGAGGLLVGG